METSFRLKKVYSLASEKKLQDANKFIVSCKLSKDERCEWFCRAVVDKQKQVAQFLLHNGFMCWDDATCKFYPDGCAANKAKGDLINALMKIIPDVTDFPASLFLDLAINEGNEELVTLLLRKGADVHSKLSGPFTAVQLAVMKGHSKLVEILLAVKADVNSTYKGSTLLHAAVFRGDEDIVALLLRHGANVNAKRDDGSTALCTAVEKKCWQIAKRLIDAGADIKVKTPTLMLCLLSDNLLHYFNYLRLCGADPFCFPTKCPGEKEWTLLHSAVSRGDLCTVDLLLKKGSFMINNAFRRYQTPLHLAAVTYQEEMVKLLIKNGAEVNFKCAGDHTLLHYFAADGKLVSAQIVLKYGADIDAENYAGQSPLFTAAKNNQIEMVKLLLERGARTKNKLGETPLHAVAESGDGYGGGVTAIETTKLLLDFGVDTEAVDRSGETALHIAWRNGYCDILNVMLGRNVKFRSANEGSALLGAVLRADKEIVKLLLKSGASVNCADWRGITPLHIAAQQGRAEVVDELLNFKAQVDAKDSQEVTALGLAVYGASHSRHTPTIIRSVPRPDHLKIIRALLKLSADFNSVDMAGITPLRLAASGQETKSAALRILLEYGNADTHVVSEKYAYSLFSEVNAELLVGGLPVSDEIYHPEDLEMVTTSQILVWHVVKMRAAKLYLSDENLVARRFDDQDAIGAYRETCEAEVAKMRREKIGDTQITFYDLLIKPIHRLATTLKDLAENVSFFDVMTSADLGKRFPIFGNILLGQYDKGKMRKELLQMGVKIFHLLLNESQEMPYHITERIAIRYFGNKDLRNLITVLESSSKLKAKMRQFFCQFRGLNS